MTTPSSRGWPYTSIKPEMFQHADKMDVSFLYFLDRIVAGMGWFTKITSDYRDPDEQSGQAGHGGAKVSLHEFGEAVDLRMPWIVNEDESKVIDHAKLGLLVDSICLYRNRIKVELEIDITPDDPHIHIGRFGTPGGLLLEPVCRHTGVK